VERQLGHPVIKAFNSIYAAHLLETDQPRGMAGRIALPVAGDDQASPERPPGFRASADSPGTFMEPR
jgi:predicted dinucleotide-binding enzyme